MPSTGYTIAKDEPGAKESVPVKHADIVDVNKETSAEQCVPVECASTQDASSADGMCCSDSCTNNTHLGIASLGVDPTNSCETTRT